MYTGGENIKPNANNHSKIKGFINLIKSFSRNQISFKWFSIAAKYYGEQNGLPTTLSDITKLYNLLHRYYGIGNNISINKLNTFNIEKNKKKVLRKLKSKGVSRNVSSGAPNCSCPSDYSQAGYGCNCIWGICGGQCEGNTCMPCEFPWCCC